MQRNSLAERLHNGIIKENPIFVLMLGMCPTLAVTTSAFNGLGMGLTSTIVLIMSNFMISLLRKAIPNIARMPIFIVIVAVFVTVIELLLQAYMSGLYDTLGIFIPLIVVNCIILGRAEAFAFKNPIMPSIFDAIGMGLGFTVGLTAIGCVREFFGNGTLFDLPFTPSFYQPVAIFVLAPGAFFVLAILSALQNKAKINAAKKKKENIK